MNLNFIPSSFLFLILIIVVIDLPLSLCQDDPSYTNCSQSFQCDNIALINYPFWGNGRAEYCGRSGFELNCQDNITPQIKIMDETYRVLAIHPDNQTMRIARLDLWDDVCPSRFENATLNFTQFQYVLGVVNLTLLYGCPPNLIPNMPTSPFTCPISGNNNDSVYIDPSGFFNLPCSIRMQVPVLQTAAQSLSGAAGVSNLPQVLREGFDVKYAGGDVILCKGCMDSGGQCGFNSTLNRFTCFCRNGPNQESCSDSNSTPNTAGGRGGGGNNKTVKIGAGVGAGVVGALLMIVGIFVLYRRRRKQSLPTSTLVPKNISPDPSLKQDLEKGSTYFQTPLFTYTELEEATNNFDSSKELGDGGFGTVYYGKLRDGRVVAVKRLYENNFKRVEQFMNEIAILSRIRHQNLVSLYGCTSRHCRELLLVYEFIPNGTIADHLHGQRNKPGFLTWPIRMNIAIESADALAYLHASDIIHRDVKTNNILLDNSYHVKVADFGLSRLFPTDKTHVSTAPQGTPGYVDPEYYQCYQLTDRSDVYSFGVVLIELISSKPAVDVNRHRHDINLANMAVTKIQNHALHELVDPHLGFESDYAIRMMITSVAELAFRCLQQEKEMRPSMMEVLEVLRGIQSEEYKIEKADEVDIPSDDVGLLKNMPPPSPDSVTEQWTSSISTTPNISC